MLQVYIWYGAQEFLIVPLTNFNWSSNYFGFKLVNANIQQFYGYRASIKLIALRSHLLMSAINKRDRFAKFSDSLLLLIS